MTVVGDIEEVGETPSKEDVNGSCYNTTVTGDSSIAPSRTSKNSNYIRNIVMSVDPSVLRLMAARVDDDEDSRDSSSDEQKRNQLFCFSCCDLVRACIVANSIYILVMVLLLLISLWETPFSNIRIDLYQAYDDDELRKKIVDREGVIALVRVGLGIFFAGIGVFGAFRFHRYLVLCSAVGYCIYTISSLVELRWIGAAIAVFLAYPNFHLFLLLRSGSITSENYSTKKHCCFGSNKYNGRDQYVA